MINTNKKSAFTLVELIVVITILAILATIAFISLQGYSADARNSKVTSDLNSIQGSITTKIVEGVPLLSFVTANTDRDIAGSELIAGLDVTTIATDYVGGVTNFQVLGVKAEEFKDPSSDVDYSLGATAKSGGVFELAGKVTIDGTPTAKVKGTYNPRTAVAAIFSSKDETSNKVTLADSDVNKFKVGDTVFLSDVAGTGGTASAVTVNKVSRDGLTLTLSALVAADTQIILGGTAAGDDEVAGLTGSSTDVVVVEDATGTGNLPY